jgi:hypothetical protein
MGERVRVRGKAIGFPVKVMTGMSRSHVHERKREKAKRKIQ